MSIAETTDQPRWSRQTQEAARIPGTEWQFETEPRAESGFDIRSIIWERKWLLIFFGAIGAALGYLEYTKEPPVYRSSASVLVDRYQPRIPIEGIDPLAGQKDPLSTHLALFNTPVILSKAIEDFRLGELSSLSSGNPMKSISDGLTVTRSAKSDDILQFTFTCGHAEDARQVLEAVIASYFDFLGETQRDASSKTLELINEAGEELAKSLSEKEQTYQKFREQSALLWTSDEGQNIHQTRLAQIEAERSGLLISSSQIRAELDAFRGALERGTSRQALLMMADQSRQRSGEEEKEGSQSSTTIASQLIPLMLEESMLLERLGSQHPKVVEIRKRIEVTRELLSREAGEQIGVAPGKPQPDLLTLYMQSLEEELKSNQEKLRELDDLFLTERDSSSKLSLDENQGRVLREELQRTKKLYDVVLEKLQEVSLVDENSTLTATIINHPSDGAQLHLKVFNYAGLGGAGGLAFGMLIGLLLEYSDKRFRSPEEMMSALNAPILGHIPEMPQLPKRRREKTLKETGVDPSIVSFHRPNSRIAEAYRLVRSSILMGIKGDRARIIQFTSPDPGDGKSTTCSNIAVATASSGKKTLLIDLDLRRPTIHRMFGLNRDIGVTTFLTTDAEYLDCIQQTSIPNLDIITAGKKSDRFGELLHNPRLAEVLEALRDKYDLIFLDSPPVLAVADAASIAQFSDSLLLVIKNSKHSRPHAKQARESLDLVSAPVTGMIVNLVSEETSYRYEGGQYRRGMYGSNYNYGSNYSYHQRRYSSYYEPTEK